LYGGANLLIPALEKLRLEYREFKASLGYTVRLSQKTNKIRF
jgi:hypothetical protein